MEEKSKKDVLKMFFEMFFEKEEWKIRDILERGKTDQRQKNKPPDQKKKTVKTA